MAIDYWFTEGQGEAPEELSEKFQTDFSVLEKKAPFSSILKKKKNENTYLYYFEFVGLFSFNKKIIAVIPKYACEHESKEDHLSLAVRSVQKYFSQKNKESSEEYSLSGEETTEESGILPLLDLFFMDFMEYGVYKKEKEEYSVCGSNNINWGKTINEKTAYLIDEQPVYLEYFTRSEDTDTDYYLTRLHKAILNDCSSKVKGLEDILDYPALDFQTDDLLSDYMIGESHLKVEKELLHTFSERKQKLLKAMKSYIEEKEYEGTDCTPVFGIKKFHNVWEKACQEVFKDQYADENSPLREPFEAQTVPKWKECKGSSKPMKPDIVIEESEYFWIMDAKYYLILEGSFPGVQDVVKQLLYMKVYSDCYLNKQKYNLFLCPGKENKIIDEIELPLLEGKILVISINPTHLFKAYVEGSNDMSLNKLKKHVTAIEKNQYIQKNSSKK